MVLRQAMPNRDRLASSHRWRCYSGECRPPTSRGLWNSVETSEEFLFVSETLSHVCDSIGVFATV
jgi:hypothetical protein